MLFKKRYTADNDLGLLGFHKIQDDEKEVCYRRVRYCNEKFHYIRISKRKGKVLVSSYQEPSKSFRVYKSVALTAKEMELCLKKIKEKGWEM